MTRWMHRDEVERVARVTDGECPLDQDRVSSERSDAVSIPIPEGWLDRIQVGFPLANRW